MDGEDWSRETHKKNEALRILRTLKSHLMRNCKVYIYIYIYIYIYLFLVFSVCDLITSICSQILLVIHLLAAHTVTGRRPCIYREELVLYRL